MFVRDILLCRCVADHCGGFFATNSQRTNQIKTTATGGATAVDKIDPTNEASANTGASANTSANTGVITNSGAITNNKASGRLFETTDHKTIDTNLVRSTKDPFNFPRISNTF